ncbi:testis-expressed protein 13B [Perognathus longimembris pacificus]|uniref:testis-expressed protein 13B n=1 Tax=Perognathus longimembris pacificus TaxID=214514 RepID=UPI002019DC78|nr:testis-expressed protein 13B [Perognathus longimembris pacificus]
MALRPNDPTSGFHHDIVLAFINEQMARHPKGPQFYLENLSLSWEEIEDKFKGILEDNTLPKEAHEACAWSSLALGVRFARRQGYLHGRRVQWLHDFARLHKSAANALASDLKQLSEQQDMERREAAFQLRVMQTKLAEVQKERDMLRWKLLRAVRSPPPPPPTPWPRTHAWYQSPLFFPSPRPTHTQLCNTFTSPQELSALPLAEKPGLGNTRPMAMTTASNIGGGDGTFMHGTSEKEEMTGMDMPTANVSEPKADAAAAMMMATEATEKPEGSFQQLLGAMEWKNYPLGGQGEGIVKTPEKATYSPLGTPEGTDSPEVLTVQLPASFTYSYECPFPVMSTPSPPPPRGLAHLPPVPSYCLTSDFNLLSDMGATGIDTQERQKDKTDTESKQERKHPIFRKPGDWDCPWCKAVNFSQRESCIRCGKGIWLHNP